LTNAAMPGLIKIGFTAGAPEYRAMELASTGVPAPFQVAWTLEDPQAGVIERKTHAALGDRRVVSNREFFRMDVGEAVVEINRQQAVVRLGGLSAPPKPKSEPEWNAPVAAKTKASGKARLANFKALMKGASVTLKAEGDPGLRQAAAGTVIVLPDRSSR
jgi:hypothetical protein